MERLGRLGRLGHHEVELDWYGWMDEWMDRT